MWSADSACRLMMLYVSINFHEHTCRYLQLLSTYTVVQNHYWHSLKGNNLKKYRQGYTACGVYII